ncbi:hypothetical protein Ccrd_011708 [Cynara cardunculus var. scolymus]|uniref:Ribosomal protein 60S n=1 Tax=Cynara cardunculus var. scolymus TaxID=59895 RepID=A0A103YIU9_CYNCS|nr:hypothetical protein Ccrd_011708 [Cynara cardunculus var. scolymus]
MGALLAKLGIKPFSYGLIICVYENGSVFIPEVLDLTEDDLVEKFAFGVSMLTSLALVIHYPTIAAAPHMLISGYKNALAIAVETDQHDPSKFAVAVPAVVAGGSAEEKKEEPNEESDDELLL